MLNACEQSVKQRITQCSNIECYDIDTVQDDTVQNIRWRRGRVKWRIMIRQEQSRKRCEAGAEQERREERLEESGMNALAAAINKC